MKIVNGALIGLMFTVAAVPAVAFLFDVPTDLPSSLSIDTKAPVELRGNPLVPPRDSETPLPAAVPVALPLPGRVLPSYSVIDPPRDDPAPQEKSPPGLEDRDRGKSDQAEGRASDRPDRPEKEPREGKDGRDGKEDREKEARRERGDGDGDRDDGKDRDRKGDRDDDEDDESDGDGGDDGDGHDGDDDEDDD